MALDLAALGPDDYVCGRMRDGTYQPPPGPRDSLAVHYARARRSLQRQMRADLLPLASKAEFERWIVERQPWLFFARPDQLPPPGDWRVWLMQAGRGAGKSRAGAEWLFGRTQLWHNHLAGVVSPTTDDLTRVTFGGPSGLIRLCDLHPHLVRKVTRRPWAIEFMNGAMIQSFTGEASERLRGPQHSSLWIDEIAGMARVSMDVFEQASFGLRLKGPNGEPPRMMISSTPKPIPLFRKLTTRAAAGDTAIRITTASTMDNLANLSAEAVEDLRGSYEGTRLGRQELLGELLTDIPGALWRDDMFQRRSVPDHFDRIVVAIDPSGSASDTSASDEIGIIVAGAIFGRTRGEDRFFVLEDASLIGSPQQWATRAVRAYESWGADRIVAEANYGGAMVESVIRQVDANVPIRMVNASRGKALRAEPVAALYEQSRVSHCADLTKLEGQMVSITASGYKGEGSPDRLDAAVWALTDLMKRTAAPRVASSGLAAESHWRKS